ncbi:PP2C family serine/threonine-protein phosphatase [Alloactinosynnema sp. L-07]|uniref:PP2C family protein-serine/threonine phosphatase n=1 Tax=Alloactinosynnema sp. L-07 TaxID=1653480 RepID=UPI000A8EE4D1|nr:serine/threonine protein phosphatase [Alloactinosynnema sp. L-07]
MRNSNWRTSSERGPRRTNADAVASYADPRTGQIAFALADGIGEDGTAARLAAAAAVRAAGDGAEAAMAAARHAVEAAGTGDCVLVIAVPLPGEQGYEIAWVGDARAYAVVGDAVTQLTTDHTLAQYFRDRGTPATPRMEHLVTASVRTAKPARIGYATVPTPAFLLLASDGVHRYVDGRSFARVLHHAPDPAAELVRLAVREGSADNATALVVQCPPALPATVAIPAAAA